MNILLPCCKADEDQAISLLLWIAELGKQNHSLHILCAEECQHNYLVQLGLKAFESAVWINDPENIKSSWKEEGHHLKSAAGPNSIFRQACWYFYNLKKGPWLFLEPDAILCRKDGFDLIEQEYARKGKPFMGFRVDNSSHPGSVGDHMSGVGVYPENAPVLLGKTLMHGHTAFDMICASRIIPNMAHTNLIFHRYRPPGFTSYADFEQRVKPEYAIYHACKDGSIYHFLRSRLGLSQSVAGVTESGLTVTQEERGTKPCKLTREGSAPSTGSNPVTCDIFIKTHLRDYPWLEWCQKSIKEFAKGFHTVNVLKSDGNLDISLEDGKGYTENTPTKDKEPGYLWQQVCKLYADGYSSSEYILFMDSDCVFTREVSPYDFIKNGKPIWLYDTLDKARPDQHAWVPVMEKFLGKKPEHEFMRRHPFVAPRWALKEMRKFCQYKHGKSLEDYIMGEALPGHPLALRFSEWNCLGFFLWEYHHDKVCWMTPEEAGPAFVYQGFTHAGEARKQEDIAKFKEILGEGCEAVNSDPGEPDTGSLSLHSTHSFTEDSAIEYLASIVQDNPHKARIVRKLKAQWKGRGVQHKRSPEPVSVQKNGTPEPGTDAHKNLILSRMAKKYKDEAEQMFDESYERVFGSKKSKTLLCIHSYPGANDTFERHWPSYQKFGADRIVGIGTTDGKCTWPDGLDAVVDIGENAYMKIRGKDDHLCRRLLDTVKWCLTQPEERFAIIEYDTIILKKFPKFKGVQAFLTGGTINGSIASSFFHNPWLFDRESGPELVRAMEAVLSESDHYPNNSPDIFFGLAVERENIKVGCNFRLFTRNSLDQNGDLELAVEAALDGVHAIHGVKLQEEYHSIMYALNEKHLSLSHVA